MGPSEKLVIALMLSYTPCAWHALKIWGEATRKAKGWGDKEYRNKSYEKWEDTPH